MQKSEIESSNEIIKTDLNKVKDQIDTWIQTKAKAGEELTRAVCEEQSEDRISKCVNDLKDAQFMLNRLFTMRRELQNAKNLLGVCNECGRHD